MSIYDYLNAQRANAASISRLPHFGLIVLLDKLYNRGLDLFRPAFPRHYGQFLVLCHQSLLSAATLIAQAQPFDSGPITRRAVEIARVSLASKFDKEAGKKWLAFEERNERWKARQEGKNPPRLPNIKYDSQGDNPLIKGLMEKLNEQLGILSDVCVHFTPEYQQSQNWQIQEGNVGHDKVMLLYFISDQPTIESEFIALAKIHLLILEVLDECVDRTFRRDDQWQSIVAKLVRDGSILTEAFSRAKQKE